MPSGSSAHRTGTIHSSGSTVLATTKGSSTTTASRGSASPMPTVSPLATFGRSRRSRPRTSRVLRTFGCRARLATGGEDDLWEVREGRVAAGVDPHRSVGVDLPDRAGAGRAVAGEKHRLLWPVAG